MTRVRAIAVCAPLALLGVFAAHQVGYVAAAGASHHSADELLAASGHDYLEHAPLSVALLCGLLALGLIAEGIASGRRRGALVIRPGTMALLGPAVFLLQEHVERLAHDGALPVAAIAQPTVAIGLLLQVPVAFAVFLVARLLLRVARTIACALTAAGDAWVAAGPPPMASLALGVRMTSGRHSVAVRPVRGPPVRLAG